MTIAKALPLGARIDHRAVASGTDSSADPLRHWLDAAVVIPVATEFVPDIDGFYPR